MLLRAIASIGLLSISTIGAFAAPAVPIYSWSGCYVGGDAGGVAGSVDASSSVMSTVPLNVPFVNEVLVGLRQPISPSSVTAGAVLGCNYQTRFNFVIGLEGDFGYMGLNKSSPFASQIFAPFLTTATSISTSWLSTVRGRVGYAVPGDWLIFATGGLAMTEAASSLHESSVAPPGILIESTDGSTTKTMAGWTVGSGLEKRLGQWSLKFEYLYADFGRISASGPALFLGTFPEGVTDRVSAHLTAQILRVGFTYKFWN
jgi:outer membrane immunogenic protein